MANTDTLNEFPLIIRVKDQSGGLNVKTFQTEIADNQADKLQNWNVSDPGLTKKREGYSIYGSLMASQNVLAGVDFRSDDDVARYLLWFTDEEVYSQDSSGTTALRATLSTTTTDAEMIQAFDNIYVSNGSDDVIRLDTALAVTTLPAASASHPAKFSTAEYALNRLFINDVDNPTYVHFSDTLSQQFDTNSNTFKFAEGAGDSRIIKLKQFRKFELLVFMNNRIEELVIDGTTPLTDWSRQVIDTRHGCIAKNTVQEIGGTVLFLDQDKRVRALANTALDARQGTQTLPISDSIEEELEKINDLHIEKSCAGVHKDFYLLCVPLDSATEPDTVFAYDVKRKSWTGPWNLDARAFVESDIRGQGNEIFFGSAQESKAFRQFTGNFNDADGAIESILITKKYDFNRPESDKTFNEFEVAVLGTGDGELKVEARVDFDDYAELPGSPLDITGTNPTLSISLPFFLSSEGVIYGKFQLEGLERGRNIDFRLTHNETDKDCQILQWIVTVLDENYEAENL